MEGALRGFLLGKGVDDAEADGGWKKSDMVLLGKVSTALHLKKIDELEEVNRKRAMMSAIEDRALVLDADAEQAIEFRRSWIAQWSGNYGSFDDIISVGAIRGDLHWPLDVFGMVAVRDSVDRNRNLLFYRARNNYQTLTEKDHCLSLSGPSRAVVVSNPVSDPVMIEVELKVKGINESKDKDLSLLAVLLKFSDNEWGSSCQHIIYSVFTSKLSSLLFTFGGIALSVEATIFIRVLDGSWPHGFHGQFAAHTSSIDRERVILLDFGDNNVPVNGDGIMKLSRQVVSVEVNGKLIVSFKAWKDDGKEVVGKATLKPAKAGRSYRNLGFGSCIIEILVAWSLISPDPEPDY
ncbi:hypothetical protein SETIT_2G391000v2 [Setaria italica]|uniref:DUF6598 domain-containing protein n=1 Tax=Setaria italica TaxID=4555 RepID=A0A368Q7S6_SETIT|nr:hypothetical protein SETIT_2G391000v2 [Setaria italica]